MPTIPANGVACLSVPGNPQATDGAGGCGRTTLYSPIHLSSSSRLTALLTCASVNKRPLRSFQRPIAVVRTAGCVDPSPVRGGSGQGPRPWLRRAPLPRRCRRRPGPRRQAPAPGRSSSQRSARSSRKPTSNSRRVPAARDRPSTSRGSTMTPGSRQSTTLHAPRPTTLPGCGPATNADGGRGQTYRAARVLAGLQVRHWPRWRRPLCRVSLRAACGSCLASGNPVISRRLHQDQSQTRGISPGRSLLLSALPAVR